MRLVVKMSVKVKKVKKNRRIRKDWNVLRRNEAMKKQYAVEVTNIYESNFAQPRSLFITERPRLSNQFRPHTCLRK